MDRGENEVTIPVFVNDQCVAVARGTTGQGAAIAADPSLAEALGDGRTHLTDGRGIRIDPAVILGAGAIIRVVKSARRPAGAPDADA